MQPQAADDGLRDPARRRARREHRLRTTTSAPGSSKYREDHVDDDPAAAHVQILERGAFAWLTGGKLVDRERFL